MTEILTNDKIVGQPELLPALTLAYIGDAVYELSVREHLLAAGVRRVEELHTRAVALVRAGTQAALAERLLPELSAAELGVFHRARNAKGQHPPKGAAPGEYHAATGLEALVGYWYLTAARERLERCLAVLWEIEEEKNA